MQAPKMTRPLAAVSLLLGLMAGPSAAGNNAVDQATLNEIERSLQTMLPEAEVDAVNETPLDGLYEVVVDTDIVYMTPDGQHLLRGPLFNLDKRVNMTGLTRNKLTADKIQDVDPSTTIKFGPDDTDHFVYVFTDVSCPYCQKLHDGIDTITEAGVQVRYIAFPRQGVVSNTGRTMRNIWCADDPQAALTAAKQDESVPEATCEDPIAQHYKLGSKIVAKGTPTIVKPNGELLPGYVKPKDLVKWVKTGELPQRRAQR